MYPSTAEYDPKYSAPPQIGVPATAMNTSMAPPQNVAWSTGLYDCCDDVGNCCITCWCPCITYGRIAEIVDQGSSSCGRSGGLYALLNYFTGCAWCLSWFQRQKMRHQYHLQENPCGDCLVHFCCEHCALCQEYRELKSRGYDMYIGWHGNVQRQSQGIVPPVVQSGMTR
ncbi:hypothetical protein Scep_022784 [Stephania cephalantha]|uniref:Uncharacterized protein n=1 Tax=Stephania cephalantha TaxID=152367 RepID=A0AAP0F633_9MAGN